MTGIASQTTRVAHAGLAAASGLLILLLIWEIGARALSGSYILAGHPKFWHGCVTTGG